MRSVYVKESDSRFFKEQALELGLSSENLSSGGLWEEIGTKDAKKTEDQLLLSFDETRNLWKIEDPLEKKWPGLSVDFSDPSFQFRVKRSAHSKEILRDALKVKGKSLLFDVIDATAGLGEDAFMMAHWGYKVTSYEKHPLVYFLLKTGWEQYKSKEKEAAGLMNWEIYFGDFTQRTAHSKNLGAVYLDPMFPPSSKKALNKKELRILQEIIKDKPPEDEELLVFIAQELNEVAYKVILKRPQRAALLRVPQGAAFYSLEASSVRLDIFNKT